MLPEHIQEILNRWQAASSPTYNSQMDLAFTDVKILCAEIESLEIAWRAAEDQTLADAHLIAHLIALLRRLRYTVPPPYASSKEERQAYEGLLRMVDAALVTH
jgi:hypothetical protein